MKLIICIIHKDDARGLVDALLEKGFRATVISTTGGFLREGNATILIGTDDEKVEEVLGIIKENSQARKELIRPWPPAVEAGEFFLAPTLEVEVGGATVFVLNVERMERF